MNSKNKIEERYIYHYIYYIRDIYQQIVLFLKVILNWKSVRDRIN